MCVTEENREWFLAPRHPLQTAGEVPPRLPPGPAVTRACVVSGMSRPSPWERHIGSRGLGVVTSRGRSTLARTRIYFVLKDVLGHTTLEPIETPYINRRY